jgi:hypothetical protein
MGLYGKCRWKELKIKQTELQSQELEETIMMVLRSILWLVITLPASLSTGYAGPCTVEIERMQARLDSALETKLETGPQAAESTSATMHRQPTPKSLAAAEGNLGNLSSEKVQAISQAMARARAADNASDKDGCQQALVDVQRAINP